jgi:CRP-like cAMP-binding protein
MATKCINCPLRRRSLFTELTAEDVEFMQRFKVGEMVVDPGTPLLMEGSNSPQLYTALSGMGLRYKLLKDGRRQVVNFVMPGDFLGLQAGIMGEMGHSVEATSQMTLCVFDRSEFWNFFKANPNRAFDVTWLAAVEEYFLGETLVTVGQRTALSAVAWALIRFYQRGLALELVRNGSMAFPFRQQDLADALGLSLVHTNKTLAKLRQLQMASWGEKRLQIMDPAGLAKIAQVENTEPAPRPIM